MRIEEDRIDVSALDPEADPDRLERVVHNVLERLGPGIVEEPATTVEEVTRILARRYRAIGAAAAIALLSAVLVRPLLRAEASAGDLPASRTLSVDWSTLLLSNQPPSAEELLTLLAGGIQ